MTHSLIYHILMPQRVTKFGSEELDAVHEKWAIPMGDKLSKVAENRFEIQRDWLQNLNTEITRYRDYEWKATTCYIAILSAAIGSVLDKDIWLDLSKYRLVLTSAVAAFALIASSQLAYIHRMLNRRRNERAALLEDLGGPKQPRTNSLWGLCEGPGFIFFIGFAAFVLFLAVALIILVWR
jgi:hypothetical protein